MSFKRLLVCAGVAVCTALALAFTAPAVTGSSRTDDGAESGTQDAGPVSPTHAGEADKPRPDSGSSPSAGDTTATAPGEMPTATPTPADGLPGLGGHRATDAPLVPSDLPDLAEGGATLVAGYPDDVLPAAPGSLVSTNSVSPSGDRLQVALVASVHRAPDAVLRFYRIRLSELGLHEIRTQPASGSTAAAFARGDSSVVVTATPGTARSTTYSVFATLSSRGG
jgi:hypothetical protein